MEVKTVSDDSSEPLTLEEIKNFLRIDADYTSDDDDLIATCRGAREKLEKELNLTFKPKVLKMQWNGDRIYIPYGPVTEVVKLTTASDEVTELTYNISGLDFPMIGNDYCDSHYIVYPVGYNENFGLFNLTYNAGYDTLPYGLKQALLIQIDYEYKNRGMPVSDISGLALSKASQYSRNLFIQ